MSRKVTITCTEKQLAMLEMICDRYARLIQGQLELSLQDICEKAWERRHKTEANPHAIGSEEWYTMRHDLEALLEGMKERFWGLSGGSYNGLGYDDWADSLWDMHQVMRYARYCAMPKDKRDLMRYTVMSDSPMRFGSEPLVSIEYKAED